MSFLQTIIYLNRRVCCSVRQFTIFYLTVPAVLITLFMRDASITANVCLDTNKLVNAVILLTKTK